MEKNQISQETNQHGLFCSTLLNIASDAIIAIDYRQKILLFNQGAQRMFGYSADEVKGHPLDTLIPDGSKEIHRRHVRAFAESSDSSRKMFERGEVRGLRKDGSVFPAAASIAKAFSGEQMVFMVIVRDITEQKNMEERLRRRESDLNEAQRLAKLGSWRFNLKNNQLYWSDELYRIFEIERDRDKITTEDFFEIVHPEDRGTVEEHEKRTRENGVPLDYTHRIITKNGNIKHIREIGYANRGETGDVISIFGTAQDISEREQTEERIKIQLRRMESLQAIGMIITSSFEVQLVLDLLIKTAVTQLHVDAADILLFRPAGNSLEYAGWHGFKSENLQEVRLKLGQGYAGRIAMERKAIFIENLADESDEYIHSTLFERERFITYCGVPLLAKGELKGVLEVYHRKIFQPDEDWKIFLRMLADEAAIAIDNAQLFDEIHKSNIKLSLAYDATIEGWSRAMDLRDKETEGHTQRVTEMTLKIASAMGLSDEELKHIRRGALLHDMGKLGVPDEILLKPDKLTDEEWTIMRQHPQYAYDMLCTIDYLKPALDIPYSHHEKWDGSGYPRGLKGEQIPLAARIFAVVDVWDALLSDRPYRAGWSLEKVLEHIRSLSGTHFDPKVVDLFMQIGKQDFALR